jgi:hypothetical protein
VSHPSLGLPPRDLTAGFPAAAAAVLAARPRLARRALEAALAADATLRQRHSPDELLRLEQDSAAILEMVAAAVASADADVARGWAEQVVPVFRRRRVPMDDLVTIADAIRPVVDAALPPEAFAVASAALDRAIEVFRWHRRLAGDARKRNRLLALLYKGA